MTQTHRARRLIDAAPEAVWAALTDPAAIARWRAPEGMTARIDAYELRPGGGIRMTLTYDDPATAAGKTSAGEDVVEGRIVALDPPRRLIEAFEFQSDDPAFAGEMTLTTLLEPLGSETEVSFTAENVPSGISESDHVAGMTSTLENLARVLAVP